jgi:hypothetical protein
MPSARTEQPVEPQDQDMVLNTGCGELLIFTALERLPLWVLDIHDTCGIDQKLM